MESLSENKKILTYILQAQEEELKRIAGELHEGIAQTLYSTMTGLNYISSQVNNEQLLHYVQNMEEHLSRTLQELTWLSTELYPPSLDTSGLVAALKAYLKNYTSTFGILVHLESVGEEQRLTFMQEVTLLRVCQEVLYNSAKHADTGHIDIQFSWLTNELLIEIKDYGIGFHLEKALKNKKALGLLAMKHRMDLINGKFNIQSQIGKGTEVCLTLPSA